MSALQSGGTAGHCHGGWSLGLPAVRPALAYRHRRGVGANADGNRLTGGGQVIGCSQIPVRLHRQHGQGVYLAAPPPTLRIPFIRRRPLLSLACPCLVDEVFVSRPGRPAEATRDAIRRAARSAPAPVGLPERVVSPTARSSATCAGVGASFSARRSRRCRATPAMASRRRAARRACRSGHRCHRRCVAVTACGRRRQTGLQVGQVQVGQRGGAGHQTANLPSV